MKETSDELTRAEVEAAHLGDRRAEAERELAAIAERLGEEIAPAEEALSDEERAEIDRRLERLERRRAQIGPVNPLAEQEYEEAREHVEALQAQREDIERSMRELESLIRDIDDEIERAFEETFEATAKNFEEMVEHLFPGGRGRLRRVSLRPVRDEERPPASRRRRPTPSPSPRRRKRSARSSGSRSRSPRPASRRASSRCSPAARSRWSRWPSSSPSSSPGPCPFYILDEVEAALDDANIDRFLQLIRRFSDRAQFVIVTHQKRTMDAADVLYGVSMGGDGVTKVVSRRLPREVAERRGRGAATFAGVATERRRPRQAAADGSTATCRRGGPLPPHALPAADGDDLAGDRRPRRAERWRRSPTRRGGGAEERRGVFRRLRESLSKSRQALTEEISASLFDRIDEETWERLEEALILADVGAPTTAEVVERLEQEVESGAVAADGVAVRDRLIEILAEVAVDRPGADRPQRPSRRC